ncbi:hypothetical protein HYS79_01885 [Patescibacteria group bacterium]|nr:hypothetical protein [Patescibacteria group bacterium]
MQADKNKFYELIDTINTLNIEYPMIEIRIQQDYVGRGATASGIAPIIKGEQKKNRDAATAATYEATILDQKLRSAQLGINKICIASGVSALQSQQTQSTPQPSPVVIQPPQSPDTSNSPYQNIREHKVYREVMVQHDLNPDASCSKLSLTGEDLAMCYAYDNDPNKNQWTVINKPDTTVITPTKTVPIVATVDPAPNVQPFLPKQPVTAAPTVKKTQALAAVATALPISTTTDTTVVTITPKQDAVSTQKPLSLWEKVVSPFKYLWGMIFR